MKQIPILFSTPMVQAILGDRKNQTRRIMKQQIIDCSESHKLTEDECSWKNDPMKLIRYVNNPNEFYCEYCGNGILYDGNSLYKSHYKPGDILWVREEHYMYGHWEPDNTRKRKTPRQAWKFVPDITEVRYSDNPPESFRKGRHKEDPQTPAWHKRLARFMPKAAVRIWLKVLDVYPERVQDITEEAAKNEGAEMMALDDLGNTFKTYRRGFESLWSSINGDESWKRNDWVWRVEFERTEKP